MGNYKMVAKTFAGLETLLAKELGRIGAGEIKKGVRSVSFEGDKGFMYKANLSLRTALRILKPIAHFKVFSEDDFYRKIYRMDWAEYLDENSSFAIYSTVHSSKFTHSKYVALKAKDAIVDLFRNKTGKRPDVDLKNPKIVINIHIQEQSCIVSLDSSGSSLHKRGYRSITGQAPINEVLAAGLLLHSGWDGFDDFLDPMCGSGTILIEAAMIAANIPPNLNKTHFGFQNWPDWDVDLFEHIKEARLNKIRRFNAKIHGFDSSAEVILKAKENIENANLSEFISVERKDFFKSKKQTKDHLHLLFNPPYGERLKVDIPQFYKKIGDTLKQHYPDSTAWLITSEKQAMKNVGLHATRKIKVFNGPLESRLLKYDIYKGSKKARRQARPQAK